MAQVWNPITNLMEEVRTNDAVAPINYRIEGIAYKDNKVKIKVFNDHFDKQYDAVYDPKTKSLSGGESSDVIFALNKLGLKPEAIKPGYKKTFKNYGSGKNMDALTHVEKAMGITEISKTPEHKEFLHNNSMIGELKKQIRQIEGEISKQPKESQERLRKTQIVPIEKEIAAREAKIKEYMNFRKANPKWPKKTGKDSKGLAKDAAPTSKEKEIADLARAFEKSVNALGNDPKRKEKHMALLSEYKVKLAKIKQRKDPEGLAKDAGFNATGKEEYNVNSAELGKRFYKGPSKNEAIKAYNDAVKKYPGKKINMSYNDGWGSQPFVVKDPSMLKQDSCGAKDADSIKVIVYTKNDAYDYPTKTMQEAEKIYNNAISDMPRINRVAIVSGGKVIKEKKASGGKDSIQEVYNPVTMLMEKKV